MAPPTLAQLTAFVAVADHRHFGLAAQAVGVSQPGLSAQIKELERRLGVVVFERSPRQVLLTEAGRALVPPARAALAAARQVSEVAAAHTGELTGVVRLGVIPTAAPYVLVDVLDVVRRRHPQAEVTFREERTDRLLADLRAGELDLAVLALPVEGEDLDHRVVAEDPFWLALPDGHPLAGEGTLPVGVLAGLPLLLLEDGHCLRDQALSVCRLAGSTGVGRTIDGATLTTVCRLVAADVGVTLLPASALSVEVRPGTGLTARPLRDPVPSRTLVLAWRRSTPFSRDFTRLAQDLSTRLAARW